LIDTFVYFK